MSDFRNSLEYREEDLSDYYNSNSNSYIDPQQVKVTYIQIDRDSLIDEGNVSEEAIRTSYEDYLSDFDDTIRKSVSHIMINIDQDRTLEEATLALINAKKKIDSGTDFEDLVIEISEDEGTKEIGGSLGITDGTLLPPEFESALENMSIGEVSEPISLLNSVHLIKLDDQEKPSPSSIEERSELIIEKLASEYAEEEYFSLLDQVSELSFSASDLQEISELIPFSEIESNFFSENNVPEALNKANIKDFLFNISEEGDYPELFEFEGLNAILVQVKESKPQTQLSFEVSLADVTNDYINETVSNISSAFISDQIRGLDDGKSLESLAIENTQTIESYKQLKRDSSLLPTSAIDDIFSLPRSEAGVAFSNARLSNGDFIIYRLDSVQSGQSDLNSEQMKSLTGFLTQQKSVSEIAEIQLSLQNDLNIERYN